MSYGFEKVNFNDAGCLANGVLAFCVSSLRGIAIRVPLAVRHGFLGLPKVDDIQD